MRGSRRTKPARVPVVRVGYLRGSQSATRRTSRLCPRFLRSWVDRSIDSLPMSSRVVLPSAQGTGRTMRLAPNLQAVVLLVRAVPASGPAEAHGGEAEDDEAERPRCGALEDGAGG